ncbi:MAG TPA: aminotransferase class III-fold pyridoxal phosphate-dependent enzyme [Solirubrobacteraceae bacterium]|nr:aminotransferase class III-fold pyridoxal phosphate-dependent enzyme [Solirubrobacteraceae bacterium]
MSNHHALWHPFADMGAVAQDHLVLAGGEGAWVWDEDGRRYLDGSAALWYANLGHGRPEIADAVSRQLRTLDAYSTFGDLANRPALDLAERLSALAPVAGSKVFLGSGGGDAIDTAAKIARAFHVEQGAPERVHLISRTNGYHGTHGIGTGIAGIPANAERFGTMLPDTSVVAWDDAGALEAEIERVGAGRVAAFFCEPVIGAGGVLPPPDGYIEAVVEVCRRHGVLFVADCVISGFGRLGTWMGIDRWPVEPDLITLAKGITGGTQPLGAVIVAPHVAAPFFADGAPAFRHGATYAGHPTTCAAANAALDLYERDSLIERGRTLERPLLDALTPLADSPLIGEVRGGTGFLAAAQLADDVLERDPGSVARWQRAVREEGVLVRALGKGLAASPPLVTTEDEIAQIGEAMLAGLSAID